MKTIAKNKNLTNVTEDQSRRIEGGNELFTTIYVNFCVRCACPLSKDNIIEYGLGYYIYLCPCCGSNNKLEKEIPKQ